MKNLRGIAFGVVCGFLGVGLLLLAISKPRGAAVQLSPPPTPAPMLVHVTGAVNEPGVFSLLPGSRVKDAVEKAGGLADTADSTLINLAMLVKDGMQIWVPSVQVDITAEETPREPDRELVPEHSGQQININTASQLELESLSGIGPVIAKSIIQYRLENGPFKEISGIQAVSGIGPVVFEKIRPHITVGGAAGD